MDFCGECNLNVPTEPLIFPSNDVSMDKEPVVGAPVSNLPHLPSYEAPPIYPQIQNIIATFDCGTKLDLKSVAQVVPNIKYIPGRFNGAILYLEKPKATALLFQSGKIVLTGTKSEEMNR